MIILHFIFWFHLFIHLWQIDSPREVRRDLMFYVSMKLVMLYAKQPLCYLVEVE